MPFKVQLKPYLTIDELKNCYRYAQDTVEARRWHLLQLVAQEWTIKQAAEIVGLSYDYAKEIVKRYNVQGPQSVRNRAKERRPPARSLLTPDQQEDLRQILRHPPNDGGAWSGPKVAAWIAERTGRKHVWAQRGWEYLKRLSDRT